MSKKGNATRMPAQLGASALQGPASLVGGIGGSSGGGRASGKPTSQPMQQPTGAVGSLFNGGGGSSWGGAVNPAQNVMGSQGGGYDGLGGLAGQNLQQPQGTFMQRLQDGISGIGFGQGQSQGGGIAGAQPQSMQQMSGGYQMQKPQMPAQQPLGPRPGGNMLNVPRGTPGQQAIGKALMNPGMELGRDNQGRQVVNYRGTVGSQPPVRYANYDQFGNGLGQAIK